MAEDRFAPEGAIWVCAACGKTHKDQYGIEGDGSRGWDESCALNSQPESLPSTGERNMTDNWYVRVVEKATGAVVKQLGPMSQHKADRVENGLLINLDYEHYMTEMVHESALDAKPDAA